MQYISFLILAVNLGLGIKCSVLNKYLNSILIDLKLLKSSLNYEDSEELLILKNNIDFLIKDIENKKMDLNLKSLSSIKTKDYGSLVFEIVNVFETFNKIKHKENIYVKAKKLIKENNKIILQKEYEEVTA